MRSRRDDSSCPRDLNVQNETTCVQGETTAAASETWRSNRDNMRSRRDDSSCLRGLTAFDRVNRVWPVRNRPGPAGKLSSLSLQPCLRTLKYCFCAGFSRSCVVKPGEGTPRYCKSDQRKAMSTKVSEQFQGPKCELRRGYAAQYCKGDQRKALNTKVSKHFQGPKCESWRWYAVALQRWWTKSNEHESVRTLSRAKVWIMEMVRCGTAKVINEKAKNTEVSKQLKQRARRDQSWD